MDTNKKLREYISAYADGELPDADTELAQAALREPDGREAWDIYVRIGDALRAEPAELSPGFAARLAEKLAAESAPVRRPARQVATAEALAAVVPAASGEGGVSGAKVTAQPATLVPGGAPAAPPTDTGAAAAKRL